MAKKTETPEKSADKPAEQSKSGINVVGFFQDSKAELGKVIWPSRQQLISESLAVVLMVSLSAGIIFAVNNLFHWVAEKVFA